MDHVLKKLEPELVWQKQKSIQLSNIWKDRGIPKAFKMAILKCLVWPVAIYGCEAWTLKQDDQNKIDAIEM